MEFIHSNVNQTKKYKYKRTQTFKKLWFVSVSIFFRPGMQLWSCRLDAQNNRHKI